MAGVRRIAFLLLALVGWAAGAVSSTTQQVQYTGTGAIATYQCPFYFINPTDLVVTENVGGVITTEVYATNYTVAGAGILSGGSITLTGGNLASGTILTIARQPPLTQSTTYQAQGPIPASGLNNSLDFATMQIQRAQAQAARSLQFPLGDAPALSILPSVPSRASQYLGFDGSGNVITIAANNASGTVVTATGSTTGRLLADRFAEVVNVKDFGAVGNGVTNDSAALLAALNYCRTQWNAGIPSKLVFPSGQYRITFAKGQSNTDPFASQIAKSWYSFKIRNDGSGWTPNSLVAQPDPTRMYFAMEGLGQVVLLDDGDANSWLWTIDDNTGIYFKLDLRNIAVRQYNTDSVARHGISFDHMWFFNHQDITASNFQNGIGMQYRRVQNGTVINRTSNLCERGLILGDPDATDQTDCACNTVAFINDVATYCGQNLALNVLDQQGAVEIWQSQGCRFSNNNWEGNYCPGLVVISALNLIVESSYFEANNIPLNGVLTSITALSGGSGYTDGEAGTVTTTDGSGAFSTCVIHATTGVVTSISGLPASNASNYGFITGAPCKITGTVSLANNATAAAAVSGAQANWGLSNHVVFNTLHAPVNANYGVSGSYIDNITLRQLQVQFDGMLVRDSASKRIGTLQFQDLNWFQQGAQSGLHWVSGEETYVTAINFVNGIYNYGVGSNYIPQISVDGTSYEWLAQYTGRKLPMAMTTAPGGRVGLCPMIQGCAFECNSLGVNNVTGDGTAYTDPFPTVYFDDNSDFNTSTGTFTAPIAGKYQFSATLAAGNFGSGHTTLALDLYKNGSYLRTFLRCNPYAMAAANGQIYLSGGLLVTLAKTDAMTLVLTVSGSTKSVNTLGTYAFTGHLVQ